jgi:hypothetical protein
MQQHGLNRDQQPTPGAAAGAAGDVDMQDTEQQENIPPAGGSQQQQQSQGGDKQQPGEKQQAEGAGGAGTQTQTQPRKTTTISAEKYEFVKVRCCVVLTQELHSDDSLTRLHCCGRDGAAAGARLCAMWPMWQLQTGGLVVPELLEAYGTGQHFSLCMQASSRHTCVPDDSPRASTDQCSLAHPTRVTCAVFLSLPPEHAAEEAVGGAAAAGA